MNNAFLFKNFTYVWMSKWEKIAKSYCTNKAQKKNYQMQFTDFHNETLVYKKKK